MNDLPLRRRIAHTNLPGQPIILAAPELGLDFDLSATPVQTEML